MNQSRQKTEHNFIPENYDTSVSGNALVVEGGAMRSVFSAGLLDGFLAQQFNPFDFYIGVSAGASNLTAYLAGSPKKSLQIFTDFALRKEFISYRRFFLGGHLMDLDWLEHMTYADSHINLDAVFRHSKPFYVCVTEVETGQARYIKASRENITGLIKASSALPVFYRGFPVINGKAMTDGGVAEGIPIAEAIRKGAKRIMVVRSRHENYLKKDSLEHRFIRWKVRRHPALIATMRKRIAIHANSISLIRNPPAGVEIIEVFPPDEFDIGRFDRQLDQLLKGYQMGIMTADKAITRWAELNKMNSNESESD